MGRILSVCNQKGGVGKSTVSVNLGVGLVREGQKVLLVDADPQGSMTASLGFVEQDDIKRTLATVMTEIMNDEEYDPFAGILHHEEDVDLMPANIELAALDVALVNAISRETIMRSYLYGDSENEESPEGRILRGFCYGDDVYANETEKTVLLSGMS